MAKTTDEQREWMRAQIDRTGLDNTGALVVYARLEFGVEEEGGCWAPSDLWEEAEKLVRAAMTEERLAATLLAVWGGVGSTGAWGTIVEAVLDYDGYDAVPWRLLALKTLKKAGADVGCKDLDKMIALRTAEFKDYIVNQESN